MSSIPSAPQDLSRSHDDNPYGGKGFDWEEYAQIRVRDPPQRVLVD